MASKNCTKCLIEKPLSEFHCCKKTKDGFRHECKTCGNVIRKSHHRTKEGLINRIYNNQKANSKRRGHQLPNYTLYELREWALIQPIYHQLYDTWVSSGYNKMLAPSFDRTDDYQGYSLNMMKIMTWHDNKKKGSSDRKNGINNKNSKAVIQLDFEGFVTSRYCSAHAASRATNISRGNISACCRGEKNSAGGFKWSY